jgi:hypothetical protein
MAAPRDIEGSLELHARPRARTLTPQDVELLAYLRLHAVALVADQRRGGMVKTPEAIEQAVAVLDRLINGADADAESA